MDTVSGSVRLTMGVDELVKGVNFVVAVMGLFGIAEILQNVGATMDREILKSKITHLLPTRKDWQDSALPIARGSLLGFFLGVLPGLGLDALYQAGGVGPDFPLHGLQEIISLLKCILIRLWPFQRTTTTYMQWVLLVLNTSMMLDNPQDLR